MSTKSKSALSNNPLVAFETYDESSGSLQIGVGALVFYARCLNEPCSLWMWGVSMQFGGAELAVSSRSWKSRKAAENAMRTFIEKLLTNPKHV